MAKTFCWAQQDLQDAGWVIGKPIASPISQTEVVWNEEIRQWCTVDSVIFTPVSKNGVTHYAVPHPPQYEGDMWSYRWYEPHPPLTLLEVPHWVSD